MRAAALAVAFMFVLVGAAQAGKKKKAPEGAAAAAPAAAEVSLSGEMMCGKCSLKETEGCQNVLKVSEGGKDTNYYLVHNALSKSNHGKVCKGTAKATVKGTVAEDGGKKSLTPTDIKYE